MLIQKNKRVCNHVIGQKLPNIFHNQKVYFIFYMYKMYLKLAEGYKNARVHILIIKNKTGKIWASMKNVQDGLGVKNMSDLIIKEIYGIYERKNLTKEQIKINEREIFEKYDSLSENELNTKK